MPQLIRSINVLKASASAMAYVFLVLFLGATRTSAGFAPSFDLQYSAWGATDIIMVTEGEKIDGHFRVQKVLKGGLAEGDALFVQEFGGFSNPEARTVERIWHTPKPGDPPPMVLSANTMVLFLVRPVPDGEEHNGNSQIHWQPSSILEDMRSSAVWVEGDRVFAFKQINRPGPSQLIELKEDGSEFLAQVSEIVGEHHSLESVSKIEEPNARAKRAVEFVSSSTPRARKRAFQILQECGEEGLPVLFDLLDQLPNPPDELFKSLALIGGAKVDQRFTELLNQELEFWRKRGPSLEIGWWNGKGIALNEAFILRGRWGVSYQVLLGLQQMNYKGSRQAVKNFREFYQSLPQLRELDQLTNVCDDILNSLGAAD